MSSLSHRPFPRPFLLWMLLSVAVLVAAAAFMLARPYWGDENHFVPVIREFAVTPWLQAWKDYPEITTPLTYTVYAAWGQVFGLGLPALRALSLLLGIAGMALMYRLCDHFLRDGRKSLLACLFLLINPYLIGAATLVFTDMLGFVLVLSALLALVKGRGILSAVTMAAALLCRQYAIVFWIAGAGVLALELRAPERRRDAAMALAAYVAALIPLALLFREWGGIVPPAGAKLWSYAESGLSWKPGAFLGYSAFAFLYLAPHAWMARRRFAAHLPLLYAAVPIGLLVWIFGVAPSGFVELTGIGTAGFAHRALRTIVGVGIVEKLVLSALATLGVWMLLIVVQEDVRTFVSRAGARVASWQLLPLLAAAAFFVVMPFSHQAWEKYMLPLLPLLALRLMQNPASTDSESEGVWLKANS